MTYIDASVVLAYLFAEERTPPTALWQDEPISSRLLQYEVWTRLHAHDCAKSHGDSAQSLLARIAMLELTPAVLSRALAPFPLPLRTLDAMHLASLEHLRGLGQEVELASYDTRMLDTARAMGIAIAAV